MNVDIVRKIIGIDTEGRLLMLAITLERIRYLEEVVKKTVRGGFSMVGVDEVCRIMGFEKHEWMRVEKTTEKEKETE